MFSDFKKYYLQKIWKEKKLSKEQKQFQVCRDRLLSEVTYDHDMSEN